MRDGWVETTLGDVASWSSGKNISKDSRVLDGEFAIVGANGEIGRTNKFLYDQPLVVVGRVGSCGETYLIHEKVWISDNALIALPNTKIDITYLYFLLKTFDYNKIISGTTQPLITQGKLKTQSVLLPPLPEQKRIVDLISSIDSYIEALQRQLESAKNSRNSLLHELLTPSGENWAETTLGEVADVIDPHPSHRAPKVDEEGIPFIGIGDLRKTGDIDFAKARRVSKVILEEHKARYNRSDFLIGLGRVASIGMVVRLPDENTDYVVSPTLAVIKANEVMGQFLFYLLEGPHSQEQFQRFKKGSTRESVGMQILRKIKIHVPPLSEQLRIVEIIKSIDDVLGTTSQALSEGKRLRSGLLSDLLSGEHEIPADYDKVIGAA